MQLTTTYMNKTALWTILNLHHYNTQWYLYRVICIKYIKCTLILNYKIAIHLVYRVTQLVWLIKGCVNTEWLLLYIQAAFFQQLLSLLFSSVASPKALIILRSVLGNCHITLHCRITHCSLYTLHRSIFSYWWLMLSLNDASFSRGRSVLPIQCLVF